MSLLLRPKANMTLRGKRGVAAIVKQAPEGKFSLAWWQRWLADHWDG